MVAKSSESTLALTVEIAWGNMLWKNLLNLRGWILFLKELFEILIIHFHLAFLLGAVHQNGLLLLDLRKLLFGKFWEITSGRCRRKLSRALWLSIQACQSTSIFIEVWSCMGRYLIVHRCFLSLSALDYLTLLLLWLKGSLFWLTHLNLRNTVLASWVMDAIHATWR